ncbi:hypothetical protein AAY473_031047 [Plecturocebus cupreus]
MTCPYERHRGEGHVKTEVETGVEQPQAWEYLEPLEAGRAARRRFYSPPESSLETVPEMEICVEEGGGGAREQNREVCRKLTGQRGCNKDLSLKSWSLCNPLSSSPQVLAPPGKGEGLAGSPHSWPLEK